ncbi:hypothetical protein A5791_15820 [Mycobacterium sp. 852002-51163_SCH5372311]|uniref:hypothetical protein n=1 Tax=Mycobacterium sp. 852002-51163_SCH5372311 TaxID=1834097 RepID=UPI0008009F78|nr:hypothetical protein [Mycobacterium sp. 852002-51163_SCH5372311]OBF91050.1 hypothetical protein A5791_15820 [Mycobacterium sp. 852002-51163_SCH5372311]
MPDSSQDNARAERQRILDQQRQRLGEAHAAHQLSDEESELALLSIQLDAEQQRLDELLDRDPMRAIWFDLDGND